MKTQDAIILFSNLAKFFPIILVIPHPSANVVRVFSRINLIVFSHRVVLTQKLVSTLNKIKIENRSNICTQNS